MKIDLRRFLPMGSSSRKLIYLPEPLLLFRHSQAMEDPRDGLTLFGPLDVASPLGVRAGVVGTDYGAAAFRRWVAALHHPVRTAKPIASRPPYPGFETVFRIPWADHPLQQAIIPTEELKRRLYQDDRHLRVYQTVELFAETILRVHREEEAKPDIWFVVIPDDVRKYCRPQSNVEPALRHEARREFATSLKDNVRYARKLQINPSLFATQNEAAEPYAYKEHFRNQLKARLLIDRIPTQIVRESTLTNVGAMGSSAKERAMEHLQSQIAWNMSTTAFYKLGGRPGKSLESGKALLTSALFSSVTSAWEVATQPHVVRKCSWTRGMGWFSKAPMGSGLTTKKMSFI